MSTLINKKRLNYMQAWIKEYDDGIMVLQSYNTDVVKRTPDGQYIRLWDGWSVSTSKQVKTWCGHFFRDLPFADGTVEDRSRKRSARIGYSVFGLPLSISKDRDGYYRDAEDTIHYLSNMDNECLATGKWILGIYNSGYHKKLKDFVKGSKDLTKLIMLAKACAIANKEIRIHGIAEMKNEFDVTAKFYDYDFSKILEAYNEKHEICV